MAVWSIVNLSALSHTFRLDAEYYQPNYLGFEKETIKGELLDALVQAIMHPMEIIRVYSDCGLRILLAQNIRPNYLDLATEAYMSPAVKSTIARNFLKSGDILMTRSGANFGDTACYLGDPAAIYACADCLIIRPANVPPGYLSTFFNTKIGRELLTRGAYGMAQPHIAPTYLRELRIPRLGNLEKVIHGMVEEAYALRRQSITIYQQAEAALSIALGLDRVDLAPGLFYEDTFSHAASVGRLDAEYFSPRMQRVIKTLSRDGLTIADKAPLAKRHFKPIPGQPFEYIEIADIGTSGIAESKTVLGEDAPSRATWIVRPGDIITTTVRPIRRLSAVVLPEQNGFVCSSGFAVLKAREIEPELLLTYLRLPLVAELLDLHTTASMYPAISTTDLLRIPVSLPDPGARTEIVSKVRESLSARAESIRLLEEAKSTVEAAILEGG